MNSIIEQIRQRLKNSADEKTLGTSQRFFKENEQAKVYGVKIPTVSKIAKDFSDEILCFPKADVFAVCEELWKSGYLEEAVMACEYAYALRKDFELADFETFERWVRCYVKSWADCDTLCNHTIGSFLMKYPDHIIRLKEWARSNNRWMRRAAAVTLIIPARRGMFLDDVIEIASILLMDRDDLVQKGYGWMLKAASLSERAAKNRKISNETKMKHLERVFHFIMRHKAVMPRTALRYAIEKMPAEMRAEAMKKPSVSVD